MNATKAKKARRSARSSATADLDLTTRAGRKELHRRQELLRRKVEADKRKAEQDRWNALTPEQQEEETRAKAAEADASRRRVMGLMGMVGALAGQYPMPHVRPAARTPYQRGR